MGRAAIFLVICASFLSLASGLVSGWPPRPGVAHAESPLALPARAPRPAAPAPGENVIADLTKVSVGAFVSVVVAWCDGDSAAARTFE